MKTIIILAITLAVLIVLIVRTRKSIQIIPTLTPKVGVSINKLIHYSIDIQNNSIAYGLFQVRNSYYLVNATSLEVTDILDLYPAFKGRPIGLIVSGPTFIIFSSDGKVYNPFTISHPWRKDFFYLPYQDPIGVDGRTLENGISNGLFNNGNINGGANILFRFYYRNYYIDETGCVAGMGGSSIGPSDARSCSPKTTPFLHPSFNVVSYYQYAGVLYGVSSDGWIYSLSGSSSESPLEWIKSVEWVQIFNGLVFPSSLPQSNLAPLYLLGADYDDGVPVFLVLENNNKYLIDRDARKYDFTKTFNNQGILPVGNPVDFTKAGSGEFDYVVLYQNGVLYGPTLKGYSKPVDLFIQQYPSVSDDTLISITSVNKWNSGVYKYFLVFLFGSGRWFEIGYDIQQDTIGEIGQTDQTSGLWTSWNHVKNAPLNGKIFKISSYGWSIFAFDPSNKSNNMVYSINNQPESWMQMLYCTPKNNPDGSKGFATSACVGLKAAALPVDNSKVIYQDYGTATPGITQHKVSLQSCLANNYPAIIYDSSESDCHLYTSLLKTDTYKDPTKTIFIDPSYDATFRNRFCIQHVPTGKYLYWDFTNPDSQYLGLNDTCIYQGISNLQSASTGDIVKLQKSMGAMWSMTGNALLNMNSAVGGYLQTDGSLGISPDNSFSYINGTFTNQQGCFHANPFGYTSVCSPQEWLIKSIPCPPFTSTGYIFDYCKSEIP